MGSGPVRLLVKCPTKRGNYFSPSLFSYQDGLSWHLHICGQSVPSAITVLPCSSDPLVTSCSQFYTELRTARAALVPGYGRAQPPIGRARAPVCPSLATPLNVCKSRKLETLDPLQHAQIIVTLQQRSIIYATQRRKVP